MPNFYILTICLCLSQFVFSQVPLDENFDDDAPTSNLALTLTNDGVIYFEDGLTENGHYIDIFESSSYGLNFPVGSKAMVFNAGQGSGGTHYGFKSQNGNEFRLASVTIDVYGTAGGGFASSYIVRGYRNGTQQTEQTVNFSATGTYGAINYNRNLSYYEGGTLTFSMTSEWKNIDEIRFYWNNNSGMGGAIKSIDFEQAITSTVPVTLLNYQAKLQADGNVTILWSTAQEINNSHFVVERSKDGSFFDPIGQVAGKGTFANKTVYSYTDVKPYPGTNYYRLVQYDLDGRSKMYAVKIIQKNTDGVVAVFPNPLKSNGFTIKLSRQLTLPMSYTINSTTGIVVAKGIITHSQQFIPINTPLAKGIYILGLENGMLMKLNY